MISPEELFDLRNEPPGWKQIRVLLVDDHAIWRHQLAKILETEPDIEIAGEATDGRSAVELVPQLRPDVVIMDVQMPRMDGIQATRIIHQAFSDVRIIGFSFFEEGGQFAAMRESGAADCVSKDDSCNVLLAAIRNCMSSGR